MCLTKNKFIERSLVGAVSFLKEAVFADEYAQKRAFLQLIDPRAKLVTFAVFLITALFVKKIELLAVLYLVCLLLAVSSKIRLGYFLNRTWIFIPIFSLFIAVPALFNIFSPGEAIFNFSILELKFSITRQGVHGASLFVSRVLVSVSYAVLLSLTTAHTALLKVLRIFKIPQLFVMTLGMCYRYIYLFLEIIENTYLALKSRVGGALHYAKGQRIVAWNIAFLWQRSYSFSSQIYQAMLSRGYSGEPKSLGDFRFTFKDVAFLVSVLVFCAFVMLVNLRMR